jgi:hypothetical protein
MKEHAFLRSLFEVQRQKPKEIKKEPLMEGENRWVGGMIEGMHLPKNF